MVEKMVFVMFILLLVTYCRKSAAIFKFLTFVGKKTDSDNRCMVNFIKYFTIKKLFDYMIIN